MPATNGATQPDWNWSPANGGTWTDFNTGNQIPGSMYNPPPATPYGQASNAGVATAPWGSVIPQTVPGASAASAGSAGAATSGFDGPSIFGTGMFQPKQVPINDQAITGSPTQGASSNYGLNDIMSRLGQETANLQVGNYAATAPQGRAAQGTAAQGTAAQGAAALGTAAQGQAATGTAAGYNAATGGASTYQAAQGGASSIGQVQGQAAQARAAQMQAAQGGYATAGPTTISTAGDAAWQQQQQSLANLLSAQAQGGGVSPADLQLRQGADQQVAANLAVLGSQRGSTNAALAQRSAANARAAAMQNMNQQLGVQRAQETLNAQNALGSVLGTARGQAQSTNQAQAQLTQQEQLANASNAQQSLLQNAGFQQQAATTNVGNAQQTSLANLAAENAQTQQNAALAEQANEFNAGNSQAMTLANLASQNQAAQFNAGNEQAMTLANLGALNQAASFNAGNSQQMTLANLAAQNQMTGANVSAENALLGQNLQAANAMTGANLTAQNQFGLNNVENSQAAMLANLGNQQQTDLANLQLAGQYGLANQSTALQAQNEYEQQLLALLGAQTGVAQANRSAQLADQQLQVQQQTASNQVGAEAFAAAAQNNANLTGAIGSAFGTGLSSLLGALGGGAASALGGANPESGLYSNGNYIGGNGTTTGYDGGASGDLTLGNAGGGYDESGNYVPDDALSDENVKTGIEGGNPMLRSFLDQYGEAMKKTAPDIDPTSGENFRTSQYSKQTFAKPQGRGPGDGGIGTIIGLAGALAGQPEIGAALGAAEGQMAGGPAATITKTTKASDASGYQPIGVTDADAQAFGVPDDGTMSLSDDEAKENVSSGNRGMQAFLEQQNAQTSAQNLRGAQSNAFMQVGQAPRAQVDRQLPPGAINAGYGAPARSSAPGVSGPSFAGGVTGRGTVFGGGLQGGGFAPGSVLGQAAGQAGGLASLAGIQPAGTADPGGIAAMAAMQGGGGVTNRPSLTAPGTLAALGGQVSPPPPFLQARQTPGLQQNAARAGQYAASLAPNGLAPQTPDGMSPLPYGWTASQPQGSRPGLALSDEREKRADPSNPSPEDLQAFHDALHAHQYKYKDPDAPGAGPGTYVSPMAQELEESPLGRHFVFEGPAGRKMVDYGHMAGTMLAGQAMLNERVGGLERLLRASGSRMSA